MTTYRIHLDVDADDIDPFSIYGWIVATYRDRCIDHGIAEVRSIVDDDELTDDESAADIGELHHSAALADFDAEVSKMLNHPDVRAAQVRAMIDDLRGMQVRFTDSNRTLREIDERIEMLAHIANDLSDQAPPQGIERPMTRTKVPRGRIRTKDRHPTAVRIKRAAVTTTPCRECGAAPGEPCRSRQGYAYQPADLVHGQRLNDWYDANPHEEQS